MISHMLSADEHPPKKEKKKTDKTKTDTFTSKRLPVGVYYIVGISSAAGLPNHTHVASLK